MTSTEWPGAPERFARRRRLLRRSLGDRRVGRAGKPRAGQATYRGRAWINGREVGGVDPRYIHLSDWLD